MSIIPQRAILAVAAVVEIAMHATSRPISAKTLAERYQLAPRHLEPLLQALVHAGILKGVRGPHGGYQIGSEANGLTVDRIVDTALSLGHAPHPTFEPSQLISEIVLPALDDAQHAMKGKLNEVTIEMLAQRAIQQGLHLA